MKTFKVLDRHQDIFQNTFIEASAGTGKTFTIENIVVRLLIEKTPLSIDQILIVTFTRAATKDLKLRIHNKIYETKKLLKNFESSNMDYLQKIIEEGKEAVQKAIKRLDRALSDFDFASIYTIHSFCKRMLSENAFESQFIFSTGQDLVTFDRATLKEIIRDFFRTEHLKKNYSKEQRKLLLKSFGGDFQKLENALIRVCLTSLPIDKSQHFKDFADFAKTMQHLKSAHAMTKEKILQDFILLAPLYKGNCDQKGKIKQSVMEKIDGFADLFEKKHYDPKDLDFLIADQLSIVKALDPSQRKAKAKLKSDFCQIDNLQEVLKQTLLPYVSVNLIFSRLAQDVKEIVEDYKEKQNIFSYDDLLKSFRKALVNPDFKEQVSTRYRAALIDEFQDTDPLQWEIFHTLFLEKQENCFVYLVGDPKQSIYAFRQADIYTYLLASECFAPSRYFSLNTNFRSQPELLKALNVVFNEKTTSNLFFLPKRDLSLQFPLVNSPKNARHKDFRDDKGALHFFVGMDEKSKKYSLEKLELEAFFPFIVNEIFDLVKKNHLDFDQMAILVSDRYQAERVYQFLSSFGIPSSKQRQKALTDTAAFHALKECIQATYAPKDESLRKIALGGKILRLNDREFKFFDGEKALIKFLELQSHFLKEGFEVFFQKLLTTCWKEDAVTVLERILSEDDGKEFLQDLFQVRDWLLETVKGKKTCFISMLYDLEERLLSPGSEQERLQGFTETSSTGVKILTLHSSKGLEFDIVFAIGLVKRKKVKEMLTVKEVEKSFQLTPLLEERGRDDLAFKEELDAEKSRQLYVAMTRAKYRLYCPIIFASLTNVLEFGEASCMDLFLARFGQRDSLSYSQLYKRIEQFQIEHFEKTLADLKETSITYSILSQVVVTKKYHAAREVNLVEPKDIYIAKSHKVIDSFTSRVSALSFQKTPFHFDFESDAPSDFSIEKKTAHTLPAGSETGNLLHAILQQLSFEKYRLVDKALDLLASVQPFIKNTLFEPWTEVICQIVFNAIKTQLVNKEFCLCDVPTDSCFKEGEFLFQNGFTHYTKGFIDLFFMHNDKYYLLDWKSNWLGPNFTFYNQDNMFHAMQKHFYFVQADIYQEAVKKYLKIVDPRPFEAIFGGVFYVFLRGVTSKEGIYHFKNLSSHFESSILQM